MKRVHAAGLDFAYLEAGEGPLVLMLHGFPDTAHTWDLVRPALARAGFRVVCPFMRGYAPTAIPADGAYDADTLGRDVLALIEALGHDDATVVGHDWGASAAYSAAGLAPERVRLLVTLGIPHPAGVLPGPRMLWGVRHFFWLRRGGAAAKMRANDYAHLDELVARWSPAWNVPAGETDAVKRAFSEPGCLEAALGYYRAIRPRLPPAQRGKISVPNVAFAGLHDGVVVASDFERARRCFTGAYEIVTMPGGHFMHREHPEHFERELLRVLAHHVRGVDGRSTAVDV